MEELGIKKCSKCKEEFLLEEFYRRSDRDAPVSQCKWCCAEGVRERQKKRRAKKKKQFENGEIKPIAEKWCIVCDQVLPWQDFYIKFDAGDLLSHYCRKCHNSDNKEYRKRTGYKRKKNENNS